MLQNTTVPFYICFYKVVISNKNDSSARIFDNHYYIKEKKVSIICKMETFSLS